MPPSAPVDPRATVRAQLAYTLRALRTLSGLSQDQLAKELYATRESIAAYESGRNRPDAEFCAKLDGHFGTGEMFQGLWHHARREHLREWFEEYVGHETAATEIRTFQPLYIPGLLQTEGYIRAASRPNTVIEEGSPSGWRGATSSPGTTTRRTCSPSSTRRRSSGRSVTGR
jgi:transcriptional regulator with XRE-family HTH domain